MNTLNKIGYPYNDENNNLLYTKVRVNRSDGKSFYFESEQDGKIVKNAHGCRKVLYQLPQLMHAIKQGSTIFLVEGEKDANTLMRHQIPATTAPGSLEWCNEYTQVLKDADIVILYDNDKTGHRRRDLLCKELYGNVKRLRVVDLPGLEYSESHGKDITDWLNEGHNLGELLSLVKQTPDYVPPATTIHEHQLRVISLEEFLSIDFPKREMLIHPFLPSQGLALLFAKRGVGKTHVALGIAYAVASGGTFLKWAAPTAKKVLYIDGEMPGVLMKERIQMAEHAIGTKAESEFFNLITPDLQSGPMPDLSTTEGKDAIKEYVDQCDLIILDNISCLFRSSGENEAESWQDAQNWILDLRRRGKSVLLVHHAGKTGAQRGTSKREDILDVVITLKHPDDYSAEEGARFEVYFDKARHFSGEDASPFQAHLKNINGAWGWEVSHTSEQEEIQEVVQLLQEGASIRDIAKQTKLTKSQVETLKKKAEANGFL